MIRVALAVALVAGIAAGAAPYEIEVRVYRADPPRLIRHITGAHEPYLPIVFHFDDASLMEAVRTLADHMGRNIEAPPELAGQRITLIGHHPMPRYQALNLMRALLASRGFEAVDDVDGNLLKIVRIGSAPEKLDVLAGGNSATVPMAPTGTAGRGLAFTDGTLNLGRAYLVLGTPAFQWAGFEPGLRRLGAIHEDITPGERRMISFESAELDEAAILISPAEDEGTFTAEVEWLGYRERLDIREQDWAGFVVGHTGGPLFMFLAVRPAGNGPVEEVTPDR